MDLIFQRGAELTAVRVMAKNLSFAKVQGSQYLYAPLEGLSFNRAGIVQEFPDLKDKTFSEMKAIATQRLKEHVKKMNTDDEIKEYLKSDLRKHGYKLICINRPGWRPEFVKNE